VNVAEQDPVINPALGEPFATCPRASEAHVERALEAAARAYRSWRRDESLRRAKLKECTAALQGRAHDIAGLLSQEQAG
jgi:acyl-CoA reductase-like NAD-dependent aldehyde dehydrogenase